MLQNPALRGDPRQSVLPASGLDWSDIGNWDSLFSVLLPDEHGNIVFAGRHIALDTSNTLVYGNRDERLVVTIGLDDLIIVDSGDVLLAAGAMKPSRSARWWPN